MAQIVLIKLNESKTKEQETIKYLTKRIRFSCKMPPTMQNRFCFLIVNEIINYKMSKKK